MSTQTTPKPAAAEASRPKRYFPGWIATMVILVCLAMIFLVRIFRDELALVMKMFDTAAANLSTVVLSFLIGVTLTLWFLCFSDYSWKTKAKVCLTIVVLIVVVFSGFQIDGPTGDMAFALVPRPWLENMLPSDAPPPAPQAAGKGAAASADLTVTSSEFDFPRFLGPDGNNYLASAAGQPLARDWEATPPRRLWKQSIGQGWSAFAIVNNFAVTLEQHANDEWVSCYDMETGALVWKNVNQARHEAPMGGVGPRSTPTIHNGRVYTIGGLGLLQCLDGKDGSVVWQDDVLARCGTDPETESESVMWGRAGSPLVLADLGLVVVPGGGKSGRATSLVAYDAATGAVRWQGGTSQISYVTPIEATLAGRRQIVSVNEEDVTGHDIETGQVLWKFGWPGSSTGNASCSQPHVLSGDRLLLSKGYGEGAEMIRIVARGGNLAAESVWKNPRALKTKFTNLTIIGDHAYGLSDGILECAELETGDSQWRKGRYGHGQVLGVGDLILVLGESGQLALVEANPEKYVELGRIDALDGKTWNSIALSGKRLLVRNAQEAACYELP